MQNYFNYFTEIERYYQSKRESFTLLSTLDWVLIETWKDQGIPLDTVLKGIDRAFSRAKRKIGSLAYCVSAVNEVSEEQRDLRTEEPGPPDFTPAEVKTYLEELAGQVRALARKFPEFETRIASVARSISELDTSDLHSGESTLNALEEKLIAIIKVGAEEDALAHVGIQVEKQLTPFRSKMTVEQLARLEQQLWKRTLMEQYGAPRLSLFYLI